MNKKFDDEYTEKRVYSFLFLEGIGPKEASKKLKNEGIDLTANQLQTYKKNIFKLLHRKDVENNVVEYILDSLDEVKEKFQMLTTKTESLITKFEEEGREAEQMVAMRDLRSLLEIALKRMGELKSGFLSVHAENINVISSEEMINTLRKIQETWFEEMAARIDEENQLVFTKPNPELIETFIEWKKKKLKKRV